MVVNFIRTQVARRGENCRSTIY